MDISRVNSKDQQPVDPLAGMFAAQDAAQEAKSGEAENSALKPGLGEDLYTLNGLEARVNMVKDQEEIREDLVNEIIASLGEGAYDVDSNDPADVLLSSAFGGYLTEE